MRGRSPPCGFHPRPKRTPLQVPSRSSEALTIEGPAARLQRLSTDRLLALFGGAIWKTHWELDFQSCSGLARAFDMTLEILDPINHDVDLPVRRLCRKRFDQNEALSIR
jgi:hypothetical protein